MLKSKEEWCQERSFINPVWMKQFISAIQLDAQRAAYTQCAEIARIALSDPSKYGPEDILTARNNLKLP